MSKPFLALLLAATAVAGLALANDRGGAHSPPVAAPRPPVAMSLPSLQPGADVSADPLKRPPQPDPKRNAFAPRSWAPPPAPAPKVVLPPELHGPPPPPPTPLPPPLPFVYLGQLDVQGEPTVFYLAQGDRVHAVSVGHVIDGTYRVDAEEGGQLQLTYLPLKARQALALGRP